MAPSPLAVPASNPSKRPRLESPTPSLLTIQHHDKNPEPEKSSPSSTLELSNLPATVIYEIADHLIAAALNTRPSNINIPTHFRAQSREEPYRDAFPTSTFNSTSHLLWPNTTCNDLIALSSTCRYFRVVLRRRALVRAFIEAGFRSLPPPQAFLDSELHQVHYTPESGIVGLQAHLKSTTVFALSVDTVNACSGCMQRVNPLRNWIPVFAVLPKLQFLRISDNGPGGTKNTESVTFFAKISSLLPHLKVLELVNFSFGNQPGFSVPLSNLERLSLVSCGGSWGVDSSARLPKLKSLSLRNCLDLCSGIPVGILRGLVTFNLRLDMALPFLDPPPVLLEAFEGASSSGPLPLEELYLDLIIGLDEVTDACASPHLKTLGMCIFGADMTPESLRSWGQAWCNLTELRICSDEWESYDIKPLLRSYNSWHQAFSCLPNLRTFIYSLENLLHTDVPGLCLQLDFTWCWEMAVISACPKLERLERRGTEALEEYAKHITRSDVHSLDGWDDSDNESLDLGWGLPLWADSSLLRDWDSDEEDGGPYPHFFSSDEFDEFSGHEDEEDEEEEEDAELPEGWF